MAFRWSWIFILYSLLVRLGHAQVPNANNIVNGLHSRDTECPTTSENLSIPPQQLTKLDVGAIVFAVIGGAALTLAIIVGCFVFRKRRAPPHVEEGANGPGPDRKIQGGVVAGEPRSAFSPDERSIKGFDRIRDAFNRRPGANKAQESLLPFYNVNLPPGSTDSTDFIDQPPQAVPTHVPRYPSMLERGFSKRAPPESPSRGSLRSADSVRKKLQPPPKALLVVPPAGRPLPGFSGTKTAGLRMPKSPSGRKSWFQKHPFIPLRGADNTLRFPPGSPIYPGAYQPSRQHLEARLGSPRVEARSPFGPPPSARDTPRKDTARWAPVTLHEEDEDEEDGEITKQARLVEAIQTATLKSSQSLRQPNSKVEAIQSATLKSSQSLRKVGDQPTSKPPNFPPPDPPATAYI